MSSSRQFDSNVANVTSCMCVFQMAKHEAFQFDSKKDQTAYAPVVCMYHLFRRSICYTLENSSKSINSQAIMSFNWICFNGAEMNDYLGNQYN